MLLYSACGLVVAAAATYGVLSTAWFRQRLEHRIVQNLEDLTGGRVSMNGFAFRPLILQVRISQLVIRGTEPADALPLFSAQHVEVEINPATLTRHQLILRRLQWRSAQIHLTTSPGGVSNLPGPSVSLLSEETMNDLMNMSIHDLVLAQTDLYWNNQQIPLEVAGKEAGLSLRLSPGPRYLGTFACSALSLQAPHWALPPSTFTGRFELARSVAKVSSVVWRSVALSGQGSLDFNLIPEPRAEATFRVKGDAKELAKYFRWAGIDAGDIELNGQAKYERGTWASSGRIRAERLAFIGFPVNPGRIDGSGDYSVNAQRAELANLVLSTLGGRIAGDVEAQIRAKPEFRARMRAEGLDLSATLGALPSLGPWRRYSRLGGQINGTSETSWSGNFEHLRSKFDLRLIPRLPEGAPVNLIPTSGIARGTAALNGELRLDLAQATLETPQSQLETRGRLSTSESNLAITFSTSDFEEWRPLVEHLAEVGHSIPFRLNSQATFSGTFSGPARSRFLAGRLQVGEFEFSATHWSGFGCEISARPELFEIIGGRLEAGPSWVGVQLETPLDHWAWAPAKPLNAQLRVEGAEVKDLTTAFGFAALVSGPIAGRLDLSGPPSDFAGQGEFSINQGAIGPAPFDSMTSAVHVAPAEIQLENLHLRVGPGTVSGLAGYNYSTRAATVALQGRNFSLAEIKFPGAPNREKSAAIALGGVASFDVQGGGVLPELKLSANWKVEAFALQGSPLGDLTGKLDWDGAKIRLVGASQGAGGALAVRGEAETRDDWPLELTGEFSNFEAEPWIRSFLNGRFNAQVNTGGTFRLHGPLGRPGELEAASHVEKLNVHIADLAWSNAQSFDASYAHQEISIGRFQMLGPSTSLEVAGSVKLGQPASLDITANGRADAKLLDLVDPKLQATGLSRLTMHVTGSPADPLIQGRLDVEGLSLSYGDLPFHVSDLNGPIELQGDRATATALRGRSGGGFLTLSGFATFAEKPRFEIRAALEDVRVRYPLELTSLLAGNLRLVGTPEGGRLSGELEVRQMFASESFNILTLLSEGSSALAPSPDQGWSPLAANIRLAVEVASAPAVRLETNDLHLTADLEIRLQGTLRRGHGPRQPIQTRPRRDCDGESFEDRSDARPGSYNPHRAL
ncbi:MAG: hypothetical protein DMG21_01205 [Acidobacteria bacterium]|nr:MAG: hypothetical protein DMG21_01205 [Acidobacteriota bacterium]